MREHSAKSYLRELVDDSFERPHCRIANLVEKDITFLTVTKAMRQLVKLGIARDLIGQRRNRVFVYDAYLEILNEGGVVL